MRYKNKNTSEAANKYDNSTYNKWYINSYSVNIKNRQMFISYILFYITSRLTRLLLFYGPTFYFILIRRKECWNTCVFPVNLANFVPSCYCRPHCFRYFPWCWLFPFFSSNILQMTLLKLTRVTASSGTLCYIIVNLYCFLLK